MLPCFFKHLTGFDCPGCGFQRSIVALAHGNIGKSFELYPATLFILICCLFSLTRVFYKSTKLNITRDISLWAATAVVILSYLLKIASYASAFIAA